MKKNQTESIPAGLLGLSFVAFPRTVFDLQFSPKKTHRAAGFLYAALISKVYFRKGWVKVQGRIFSCRSGECITTHHFLSEYTGLNRGAIDRALDWLVKTGYIKTNRIQGATSFFLCGYENFCNNLKPKTKAAQPTPTSLEEAEQQIGGRGRQFNEQRGQQSGKEQA